MHTSTPETLKAVQRAKQLEERNELPKAMGKQYKKRLDQARKSLIGPLGQRKNATANLDPNSEVDGSFSLLPIEQIEPYKYNPRTTENPRYAEIKESIRVDGISNILTVTRRNASEKYTTYGGGNTRLRIAKELYAEGDQRFKRLRVIIKTWPGDAQVIAAQLSENELRGDISFWEKAQAVDRFKREFEAESGTLLSSGKLRDELKKRGLSYSAPTLRTFAFAVEHLHSLGPWLESRSTAQVLRPALLPLFDIGKLLGETQATQEMLQATSQIHADVLLNAETSNRDLLPEERTPVQIEVDELVDDWRKAVADALKVTPAKLEAMLALLAVNPRVDAQALRDVEEALAAPTPRPTGTGEHSTAAIARSSTGGSAPATSPPAPQQAPLGRMLGSIPGGDQPEPTVGADGLPLSPEIGTRGAVDVLLQDITDAVNELNRYAPIVDTVRFSPDLIHGFMVDFPERTFEYFDDGRKGMVRLEDTDATRRRTVWLLLAESSRQYDRRVVETIEPDSTRWTDFYQKGRDAFAAAFEERIGMPILADGRSVWIYTTDLITVMTVPDLCLAFDKLFRLLFELRRHAPERLLTPPLQPLFDESAQEQED